MTFSPHDNRACGPEKLPAQPSTRISPAGERLPTDDFCDIPRQVHSLLKKGLNDTVQDVCTTEQLLTP